MKTRLTNEDTLLEVEVNTEGPQQAFRTKSEFDTAFMEVIQQQQKHKLYRLRKFPTISSLP